ncbi:translation initiation factor eIF-2B subunit epsilon-like [Physella acuta]|uniref:translation initiation factor eIF-2B subunit epsilon-like n=1 Tax=Physella acuta TaxID=109671 RepID=UPI0027DCC7CF|nr:translation initiation factor eIF-2B subunit epsilon-like [Physella acuta]
MAPKVKTRNEDIEQDEFLQAVVIADSFNIRFGPITTKKPRALLPLVNVPLLDYTLEALSISGVKDVYVFCCHLGEQVREHIRKSKWQDGGTPMKVTALMLDSCRSMGDVLREIDAKSLIRNDFILITGDVVSNMDISQVVKEHKDRIHGKDKSSVMTMVFKVAQPGHRSRSKEDDVLIVEEGETKRLLYFDRTSNQSKFKKPAEIALKHNNVILHNDLMDCHISICSRIVPTLFTDNFDYQTRENFVKGILINEEIMGFKIHMSIIHDKYAVRVSNIQTYDAVSKDILARWSYPLVPDIFGSSHGERIKYGRRHVYLSENVTLARGCNLQKDVVVGSGTEIGCGSEISDCIIGKNCKIGENVKLKNSFLWDNVTVGNDCVIDTALLCSHVQVLNNVKTGKGVVLSWEVVVGPNVTVAQGTRLMSEPQKDDWDDPNLSFGADDAVSEKSLDATVVDSHDPIKYGANSKAYEYKQNVDSDDDEMEGVCLDKAWGVSSSESEEQVSDEDSDGSSMDEMASDEDEIDGRSLGYDEEDGEDMVDSTLGFNLKASMMERNTAFYQELMDTFVRANSEKITDDNLTLEINSLKHAYTVPIEEVVHSLPCILIDLAAHELNAGHEVRTPVTASAQLLTKYQKNIDRYSTLLCKYIKNNETQLAALNGLGDYVLRNSDLRSKLPQLVNFLYDADILSESAVLKWYNSTPFTPDKAQRHAFLKNLMQKFVDWLKNAEEESSDSDEE